MMQAQGGPIVLVTEIVKHLKSKVVEMDGVGRVWGMSVYEVLERGV